MGDPCPSDQTADGDDGIGEVEEGVDDCGTALVAAGKPVEGVLPGVRALDMSALTGLWTGALSPLCAMPTCRLREVSSVRVLSES